MITCKRVYDPPSSEDGVRVLVDRLWPRGIKKSALSYDIWEKDLAPSPELRKLFHSQTIDFHTFSLEYRQELMGKTDEVNRLGQRYATTHLTLLYAAKDHEHNHAIVLADFLRQAFEQ